MIKTVVVNYYRADAEAKIKRYLDLAGNSSDEVVEVPGSGFIGGFDLKDFSAVILSGSQWMLSEEDAPGDVKAFIRGIVVPVLGICFGHQILARSFGAKVLSGVLIERKEKINVCRSEPLFHGLQNEVEMSQSHREYVDPGSMEDVDWVIDAVSASCPVEAMHHMEKPMYGVQFHPERSGLNGEILIRNFFERVVRSWLNVRR